MRETFRLLTAAALLLGACSSQVAFVDPVDTTCELGDFDPTGALTAGEADFEVLLYGVHRARPVKIPNGRWVTPPGISLRMQTFPIRVAADPRGAWFAVGNNGKADLPGNSQSITFVHAESARAVTLPVKQLFGDLVYSSSGKRLYAAGGGAQEVIVVDTSDPEAPAIERRIPVPHYPAGLALTPSGDELLVTGFHRHELHRVRLSDGEIQATYTVQTYPYGVTTDGVHAYVSNLGSNSVSRVRLTDGAVTTVLVGRNPEGVALSRDGSRLYVANSDSDTVSVFDTTRFESAEGVQTIDLKDRPDAPIGKSPVDVQLSGDGMRLYVVMAGENAVAVFRTTDLMPLGSIPTGWYPTTLAEGKQGDMLAIVNAKGFGAGNTDPFQHGGSDPFSPLAVGTTQKGTLTLMPTPNDAELNALNATVERNNNVARTLFKPGCEQVRGPVPLKVGQPSPIKHVVYIIRENKTYDSLLGDYPGLANPARGKPELAIWGQEITPNLRKIAERFASHDNYYSEPEQSIQGHIWATNGWSNDFSEKVWMAMWGNERDSLFLPGIEPASRGGGGSLMHNVLDAGRDLRIYGDISAIARQSTTLFRDKIAWKFPTWSLHIRDRDKARIFIDELKQGIFPSLVTIWLPNDHTSGCSAGNPYPVSEIMDNDEGTGMVIDAISKSPFWKETAVFIFEDDPQSAPDHIDGHRSILMVASPYAKRGWTSKVHVSFPSIHRTMGLMLGVAPTSRYEELATPLYDAFQEEPDLEPFDYIPLGDDKFRMVKADDPATVDIGGIEYHNCQEISSAYLSPHSLDQPDQIPNLGRILWHHRMGDAPYPEHYIAEEEEEEDEE